MLKPPSEKNLPEHLSAQDGANQLFLMQWDFYRESYYRMLKLCGALVLLILVLAAALVAMGFLNNPEPKYFARSVQNQIIPMVPLSEPHHSDDKVRQFVTDAVLESMNFTYDDYKLRLQKSATYFTDSGFAGWENALRRGTVFQQLEEKQLLMRTNLVSVPQIDKAVSKAYNGVYIWVVYVDVMRTMTNRTETISTPYRYKVNVQQVPLYERASGMAIYSIKEEYVANVR